MSITSALTIVTHLISFLGFTTLASTGQIPYHLIIAFYISLAISFISDRYKKNLYFSSGIITSLAILILLYIIMSISFFGEEMFQGIIKFLIFTQIIKHLSYKSMRDIIQIYIISFFQFIAGAIITIEIAYGIAFIIYITVALLGLIIYNMKKESLVAGVEGEYNVINKPFLLSTVLLSVFVLFMSIILFIALPRMKAGFFSSEFLEPTVLKTGFSDSVELGRVGEIKKDNSAVMRVRILNNNGKEINKNLYWRGIALDHFDGTTWSIDSDNYGDYERAYRKSRNGVINLVNVPDNTVIQEVITEPTDTDILFAIDKPAAYSEVGRTVYEVNNSYFLPFKPKQRIKYRAYSTLHEVSGDELREAYDNYSYYIRTRYLQLPKISEEMKSLAVEIVKDESNSYDKANSIKRYLLNEMNYTLTVESGSGVFPLDDFIFERKNGHCEYFATAMAVFLRINGIPSRIVNGFIGGQWNEHGKFYLIRESDAHSWVEVYYPGYGWIINDPTPSSLGNSNNVFILTSVMTYFDYLKYRWQRYVIDYSRDDQVRFFSNTRQKFSWNKSIYSSKIRKNINLGKWSNYLIPLAVFIIVIVAYSDKLQNIFRWKTNKRNEIIEIYTQSLKYLSKKGFKKRDSQTPLEFAEHLVVKDKGKFGLFLMFTKKYLAIRFSGISSTPDISELKSYLRQLKKLV